LYLCLCLAPFPFPSIPHSLTPSPLSSPLSRVSPSAQQAFGPPLIYPSCHLLSSLPLLSSPHPSHVCFSASVLLSSPFTLSHIYIYIYIYSFSRRFCPKRRTRERIFKLRAIEPGVTRSEEH